MGVGSNIRARRRVGDHSHEEFLLAMAETRIGVNVVFPFTVDPRQGIRLVGGDSALCGGVILAAGWSTQEEITGFKGDTGEAFADQMVRWAQGLGDEEAIREACMRSGETVDWLISIGKTYDAADILPPIWGWAILKRTSSRGLCGWLPKLTATSSRQARPSMVTTRRCRIMPTPLGN